MAIKAGVGKTVETKLNFDIIQPKKKTPPPFSAAPPKHMNAYWLHQHCRWPAGRCISRWFAMFNTVS